MKICIISDLHLGFRQYGLIEREQDFYNQFHKVCKEINKHNPEMVIIAGDLFDKPNPSPAAINAYREGIGSLSADMICCIKGNHTMLLRDDHYSIDKFFGEDEFEGYYYLDDDSMNTHEHAMASFSDMEFTKYVNTKVHVDGITYRNNSDIEDFLEIQREMAQKCSDEDYNILVVHQSFKEFCGFTGEELSINDIETAHYDAIICGHIHSRFDAVLSDGTKFIQPGSIERMNTTEALDYINNKKGFYLLDTEDNSLSFHHVECPRDFFLGTICIENDDDLETHFEDLSNVLQKLKVAPIISYNYEYYIKNINSIYDKISSIKENVLLNRSHIDSRTQEEIEIEFSDNEIPTVFEAIKMYGEKSGLNEEECNLAVDLCHHLSEGNEGVEDLLENYYEKFKDEYIEEESVDEELEELFRYFGE